MLHSWLKFIVKKVTITNYQLEYILTCSFKFGTRYSDNICISQSM